MGIRHRRSAADFTHKLFVRTVVLVKIVLRCMTIGTHSIIGDITNRAAFNRLNIVVVTRLDIFNKVFVIPNLTLDDYRWLINLELLILRRMRIIKNPLLKRDVFTNKFANTLDLE